MLAKTKSSVFIFSFAMQFVFFVGFILAQEVQVLTLDESITIALNKGQQIRSLKQDLTNSMMTRCSTGGFMPKTVLTA